MGHPFNLLFELVFWSLYRRQSFKSKTEDIKETSFMA